MQGEGTFWWLDSVAGTAANIGWNNGEPNNVGKKENCVEINSPDFPHNTANDWKCKGKIRALCERQVAN